MSGIKSTTSMVDIKEEGSRFLKVLEANIKSLDFDFKYNGKPWFSSRRTCCGLGYYLQGVFVNV